MQYVILGILLVTWINVYHKRSPVTVIEAIYFITLSMLKFYSVIKRGSSSICQNSLFMYGFGYLVLNQTFSVSHFVMLKTLKYLENLIVNGQGYKEPLTHT